MKTILIKEGNDKIVGQTEPYKQVWFSTHYAPDWLLHALLVGYDGKRGRPYCLQNPWLMRDKVEDLLE